MFSNVQLYTPQDEPTAKAEDAATAAAKTERVARSAPAAEADTPVIKDQVKRASAPQAAGLRAAPPQTMLGRSFRVIGDIESAGAIQIDGVVEGRIRAAHLIVSETAAIRGEIFAEIVTVHGVVVGPIRAKKVQLSNTARVQADVLHSEIAIEPGAQFEGSVKYSDNPLEQKRAKKPTSPAEVDAAL